MSPSDFCYCTCEDIIISYLTRAQLHVFAKSGKKAKEKKYQLIYYYNIKLFFALYKTSKVNVVKYNFKCTITLFGYAWIGYCFDLHGLHFQWAIKVHTIWVQFFFFFSRAVSFKTSSFIVLSCSTSFYKR